MKKCRFAIFNGVAYSTANEVGAYLLSLGLKFTSDSEGSYHFGSRFNKDLVSTMLKEIPYADILPSLSYTDFPKLLTVDDSGNKLKSSEKFVKYLLDNNMCVNSSVAPLSTGRIARGLDLYTWTAVKGLVRIYGDKHDIVFKDEDMEFLNVHISGDAKFVPNRIEEKRNKTSQKSLLTTN